MESWIGLDVTQFSGLGIFVGAVDYCPMHVKSNHHVMRFGRNK